MHGFGKLICLVKPIFEIEDPVIRRTGQIDHENNYQNILTDLCNFVNGLGFSVLGVTYSKITGNRGTREFFLLVGLDNSVKIADTELSRQIEKAIKEAMKLEIYKKSGSK